MTTAATTAAATSAATAAATATAAGGERGAWRRSQRIDAGHARLSLSPWRLFSARQCRLLRQRVQVQVNRSPGDARDQRPDSLAIRGVGWAQVIEQVPLLERNRDQDVRRHQPREEQVRP